MPALTVPTILKYRPTAKRREISDTKAKGLRLVVQPTGRMSWIVRLRRPDGTSAKISLGPLDISDKDTTDDPVHGAPLTLGQARQLAAEIDRKRMRGIDVVAELKTAALRKRADAKDRSANTFGAAAREFFADYLTKKWQARPRRWRDNAAVLGLRYPSDAAAEPIVIKAGIAEIWADKPIAEIDAYAIHTVVDEARRHNGSNRARKLHSALSVLFSWLQRHRRVTINPAAAVWRPPPPASRERLLNDAEIKIFWKACDRVGGVYGPLYQTLLLTGARLREVSDMRHAELIDGVWTIPGNRSKNHRALSLTLPQLARDIIAAVPVPPQGSSEFVFTANGRTPVSGFSKPKRHLDAEMTKIAGKPVAPFRVHDLRRTFASGLAALGIPLPIIEKTLNHISGSFGGVQGIYQRYEFSDEMEEALQRWAVHIEVLTSDKPSNVAELAPRAPRKSTGKHS
jgi:integrase